MHFKRIFIGASLVGPVVKSLPAIVGDTDLIPGLGRPHMPQNNKATTTERALRNHKLQLLSQSAVTTEAHVPKAVCSAVREATTMRSPPTAVKCRATCYS